MEAGSQGDIIETLQRYFVPTHSAMAKDHDVVLQLVSQCGDMPNVDWFEQVWPP